MGFPLLIDYVAIIQTLVFPHSLNISDRAMLMTARWFFQDLTRSEASLSYTWLLGIMIC